MVAVAPYDRHVPQIENIGCRFVSLYMDSDGKNPLHDAKLLWRFWSTLSNLRPDIYLGYTVKPNVYGSLVAHWLQIPVINNISGLGAVFINGGWLMHVVQVLYRVALARSAKVFFQNKDDRQFFVNSGMVEANKTDLLPGSGIDLLRFMPADMNFEFSEGRKFRFLLFARMLFDKGVAEFVEAAATLQKKWLNVEWCLLGPLEIQNPAAISQAQMEDWVGQGVVRYLGVRDDVRDEISAADCVVLPSYREGTPRTLLEAAAMARPIITTDTVGCRDVVDDGQNGFLCEVRNAADLAAKMEFMLQLPVAQRIKMGFLGRKKMETSYDEQLVISKYINAINEIGTGKQAL